MSAEVTWDARASLGSRNVFRNWAKPCSRRGNEAEFRPTMHDGPPRYLGGYNFKTRSKEFHNLGYSFCAWKRSFNRRRLDRTFGRPRGQGPGKWLTIRHSPGRNDVSHRLPTDFIRQEEGRNRVSSPSRNPGGRGQSVAECGWLPSRGLLSIAIRTPPYSDFPALAPDNAPECLLVWAFSRKLKPESIRPDKGGREDLLVRLGVAPLSEGSRYETGVAICPTVHVRTRHMSEDLLHGERLPVRFIRSN